MDILMIKVCDSSADDTVKCDATEAAHDGNVVLGRDVTSRRILGYEYIMIDRRLDLLLPCYSVNVIISPQIIINCP